MRGSEHQCRPLLARCRRALAALGLAVALPVGIHVSAEEVRAQSEAKALQEINRQLNNPIADLWSLVFQNNITGVKGGPFSDTEIQETLNFQPVLPFHPTKNLNLITRPVFPLVSAPSVDRSGGVDRESGLGDIALLALLGPAGGRGLLWGVGPTFLFPSATDDALGQGKWQAGPAAVAVHLGKEWVVGVLAQQWWSYAGDDDRPDTSQLNAQYFIQRLLPGAWQVGMSPNVLVDWEADGDDRLTFPVGLGVGRTVKMGKVPVKFSLEVQYMAVYPDDNAGQRWNLRLQVIPVIPPLF